MTSRSSKKKGEGNRESPSIKLLEETGQRRDYRYRPSKKKKVKAPAKRKSPQAQLKGEENLMGSFE